AVESDVGESACTGDVLVRSGVGDRGMVGLLDRHTVIASGGDGNVSSGRGRSAYRTKIVPSPGDKAAVRTERYVVVVSSGNGSVCSGRGRSVHLTNGVISPGDETAIRTERYTM